MAAYEPFELDKPASAQTGTAALTSIERNLQAVMDAVAAGAYIVVDWNYSKDNGTGSAEEPQYQYLNSVADSTVWLRWTITWTSGKPTVMAFARSTDNKST